ncbi:MAG: ATP-binding protein [Pseudanabaenaceae cyanobacterium]
MNVRRDRDPAKLVWVGKPFRKPLEAVQGVATGAEALALAAQKPTVLLCCRATLPDMTGLALLKRWRQQSQTVLVPFILILNRWHVPHWRRAMVAGADDVLAEPLGRRTLQKAIAAQLRKQQHRLAQYTDTKLQSLPARLLGSAIELVATCQDLQRKAAPGRLHDAAQYAFHLARLQHETLRRYLRYQELTEPLTAVPADTELMTTPQTLLAVACTTIATRYGRMFDLTYRFEPAALAISTMHLELLATEPIDNAFRHTRFASPVTVTGAVVDGCYRLQVGDRGVGILPRVAAGTDGGAAHGFCVGLTLVRRLCHLYGAKLRFHVNNGTQVQVDLPLVSSAVDLSLQNPTAYQGKFAENLC